MWVTVVVGGALKIRIPCGEGCQRIGWLQAETIRRWGERKEHEPLRILEMKTVTNAGLDPDDQIADVLSDGDTVIAVLKTSFDRVMVGDMFAHRYYITGIIGEGTYGHVFKARDLELERGVALKCLKKSKANRLNTKRFLREARLTASLGSHANIVTVYDTGCADDGTLFLVMELLHGESMGQFVDRHIERRTPIHESVYVEIFLAILAGLNAAHSNIPPIIHRDLKPDNVYLSKHPDSTDHFIPVLLDFGIAVSAEKSQDTAACGTRMYSSPEQTRKGAKIDARSDLWSIGVMLYQCATLLVDVPFDPFDLRLSKFSVPDVREHSVGTLSQGMALIIMKSLEVDPNQRFQSALKFREALLELPSMRQLDPKSSSLSRL
uniref:NEK6-subfamily protein kinase n=1 Tax=Spongospora subterranea TaxID=70186 RepID=A0A0H5QJQ4_9EUKA|eukprot:CRZ01857.1 hypothetical protein [Spongospora subterranea]